MLKKILKGLLLLLLFLSFSSVSQDPKSEKEKKKQQKEDHIVVDTTTHSVGKRAPDSLYLEQRTRNIKLDSIYKEKIKKK